MVLMQNIHHRVLIVSSLLIGLFSPISVFSAALDNEPIDNIATRQLHTRSLAASCAACHSTHQVGKSLSKEPTNTPYSSIPYMPLDGIDKTYFTTQMQAFKTGERSSTVMQRHAKGLNAQEITDLAEYFSAQKLGNPLALPSQKLLQSHPN